jgi:hypothetical protein
MYVCTLHTIQCDNTFSITVVRSCNETDFQSNKKIKLTFAVDCLCRMTTRRFSSCGRKNYCDGTLMLRLNPTVLSHSWLRILILIGEIIIGLDRFNFQPIPVAASSGKGLVAGPIPRPEESYRVCVYMCVCVCVCVIVKCYNNLYAYSE